MCGLFGVIGGGTGLNIQAVDRFLTQAAICDMLRGEQSTGAFRVQNNAVDVFKKAVNGYEFVQEQGAKRVLNWNLNVAAIVGHNRAATRGSVKDDNAHPFTRGAVTLVHNGHIQNHWDLADHCGITKYEVDSDIAAAVLAKYENPLDGLKLLGGAYSLVWWDTRNGTLNFARNEQRPMHFADVVDANNATTGVTLFASENGMLRWLAARNGLRLGPTYETKTGHLYTINFKNGNVQGTDVHEYKAEPYQKKIVGSTTKLYSDGTEVPFRRNMYQALREEMVELLEEEFIAEGKTVQLTLTDPKLRYRVNGDTTVLESAEVTVLMSEWALPHKWRLDSSFTVDRAVLEQLGKHPKCGAGMLLYATLGGVYLTGLDKEKSALDCVLANRVNYSFRTFNDNFVLCDENNKPALTCVQAVTIDRKHHGLFTDVSENEIAANIQELKMKYNNVTRMEKHRAELARKTIPTPAFNTVFKLKSQPPGMLHLAAGDYVTFVAASKDLPYMWEVRTIDENSGGYLKDGAFTAPYTIFERVHGKELRRVTKWFVRH